MEEEGDIEKFKDYKPSSSAEPVAPAESKAQPEPSQPKVEEKIPTKAPEPKAPKIEEASQSGDRIFASPLARKLAEDNNVNVCYFSCIDNRSDKYLMNTRTVVLETGPTFKCERYWS